MSDVILQVENVSKRYKLGQIGATTLREELQRFGAKLFHKEDAARETGFGEKMPGRSFMALDNVSFTVNRGERVGLIGRNGAGKSTLLKLISRITAPTSGSIGIDGRVASMLEVGTGFHYELTGRENIYMNGAILGMSKREIDEKIEDIIEFSECRTFIDTPVKRYSSGMYVKLAFSVAAHLNSEIMIMDEVLAVGDMAFQQKCLDKMNSVSREQGRTILYVSHNMNTIRRLCDRCIVLDGGKLVFDGDVEKAIEIYSGMAAVTQQVTNIPQNEKKRAALLDGLVFKTFTLADRAQARYKTGEKMVFYLTQEAKKEISGITIRAVVYSADGNPVTAFTAGGIKINAGGTEKLRITADISDLAPGVYGMRIGAFKIADYEKPVYYDVTDPGVITFEVTADEGFNGGAQWNHNRWGYVAGAPLEVSSCDE